MSERYAVVGHPVAHSLSPRLHAAFAAATGETLRYETLLAPLDGFAAAVQAFFAEGGAGLNVTVPFKEEAAGWVDSLEPAAGASGAVNTIVRAGSRYRGYNTDGAGLVRDLTANLGWPLEGVRVLLLGAGGAARGVVRPLLEKGPAAVVIANRTVRRAADLARALLDERPGAPVAGVGLSEVDGSFDLVINATSAGLGADAAVAEVNPAVVAHARCYDMIYTTRPGETAFCAWAAGHGARRVADGLGMLVEQAALSFELWRGVAPATGPVLELLRGGDV